MLVGVDVAPEGVRPGDQRHQIGAHSRCRGERAASWRTGYIRDPSVAPLDTTSQSAGAVTVTANVGLQVGLVETREHPFGVGGFELRVEVDLVVHGVDEAVQTLAGVGVAAHRVDDEGVALLQPRQGDAGGLVVARHVEVDAIEGGALDAIGGEVDVGVGAGQGLELHGRQ